VLFSGEGAVAGGSGVSGIGIGGALSRVPVWLAMVPSFTFPDAEVLHKCNTFVTLVLSFPLRTMSTSKKRVNLSLPPDIERALERLAKRDNVPQATKALYLLRLALEIEEDDMLNALASERDVPGAKFVPFEKIWK